MTATEERRQPEADDRVEADWVPVARWDQAASFITDPEDMPWAVMADIEGIQRARGLLQGGSTQWETGMRRAIEVLDNALENRRRLLAAAILQMHGAGGEYEARRDVTTIR